MLSLTGALVFGSTAVALAQGTVAKGYGGKDGNSASARVARPKSVVRLRFSGFMPFSLVHMTFHSDPVDLGEFTADERGEVNVDVTIPATAEEGDHLFVAEGTDVNGQAIQAQIPTRVEYANLAFTGSNTGNILALAGLLIVVGLAGMAAARRRLEPSTGAIDSFGGSPTRFRS